MVLHSAKKCFYLPMMLSLDADLFRQSLMILRWQTLLLTVDHHQV